MVDQSVLDRAELLSQMAPHPSVSADVLAGRDDDFGDGRLVNPPLTYLQNGEAPAYVFTNQKRGVALGTKQNNSKPADGRGSVFLITGRATLCLVGGEAKDRGVRIHHREVSDVSHHSGLLAKRLEIHTVDRKYHCWIDHGVGDEDLVEACSYIQDRHGESNEEGTATSGSSNVTTFADPFSPAEAKNGVSVDGSPAEESKEDGKADGTEDSVVMYRGKPVDSSYLK